MINQFYSWTDISKWPCDFPASERGRVVFKTRNNKMFFSLRPVDAWLIEKYAIDKFIVLPK